MKVERKIRTLQDNIRNSGWRIQHIPWQPEGKPEYIVPQDNITRVVMLSGFTCFLGPIFTLGRFNVPVWGVISIMMTGLALLLASRFCYGRNLYGKFKAVEANCIDRDVREFEEFDPDGGFPKAKIWAVRILCQFYYNGCRYTVTPIIVKLTDFSTEEEANRFLEARIDNDGMCMLWINPENPLHTLFHEKPKTGPYTV